MSKTKACLCIGAGIAFITGGLYLAFFHDSRLAIVGTLLFSGTTFGAIAVLVAHKLHEQPVAEDSGRHIVVRRSRSYPLLCVLSLSFLSAALLQGLIIIAPDHEFRYGLTGAELKLILLLFFPFLFGGMWFYLRELCLAESNIIMDDHGINDQRTPFKVIAWTEIGNVALDGEIPKQSIVLTLRQPAQHPKPWWQRLMETLSRRTIAIPLRIQTAAMLGDPQWLFQKIRTQARPRSDEN